MGNRNNWGILDILFVLVISFSILLFLMWMAGQILGVNWFNDLPEWSKGLVNSMWGFLITGGSSVLLRLLNKKNTIAPNYVLWIALTTASFLIVIIVIVKVFSMAPMSEYHKIQFRLAYPNAPLQLSFVQQKPVLRKPHNIIRQSNYFEETVDSPLIGEEFFAIMNPVIITSEATIIKNSPMKLCFKVNKKYKKELLASLQCGNDQRFIPDESDPGYISICDAVKVIKGPWLSPFESVAYAQTKSIEKVWIVPNLDTLNEVKKSGFTHFKLKGIFLGNLLNTITEFSYAIKVNGVPIYIDGFSPEDLKQPVKHSKEIYFEFGLENIGFAGERGGHENIQITVNLFKKAKIIKEIVLHLDYVALRGSESRDILTDGSFKFQWEASYIGGKDPEYEVLIHSTTDVQVAKNIKSKIDRSSYTYNNAKVVGVIRPPLKKNPNYGIVLGLLQPNGQIRFTFPRKSANDFLYWIKNSKNIFQKDSYLYLLD